MADDIITDMKHEKVGILALSYIIGFVTAYIAFGLENSDYSGKQISFQDSSPVASTDTETRREIGATVKADGLYALLGDKERILSAQAIAATEPNLGYHYQIVATEVSPDGKYIYYCAQMTAESEDCYNFVYDIGADTIHTVRASQSEAQLQSVIDDLSVIWQNGRLLLDGHMSISGFEPWKVAAQ